MLLMRLCLFPAVLFPRPFSFVRGFWLGRLVIVLVGRIFGLGLLFSIQQERQ